MKKVNKLLLGATTVLAPAVVAFTAFSCSTSEGTKVEDQATPDRKTTYFLDTFVMPNLDYTKDGATKGLEQYKNDNVYSWTINQTDYKQLEFVTTGLGTLYIDKKDGKDTYKTDRTLYEIPSLNFIGNNIVFVENTTNADKDAKASTQTPKLEGHYEIKNAYVDWYFKDGKKVNEKVTFETIKIYGLENKQNVLPEIQKLQSQWKPVLNADIYKEFKEKINSQK